MTKNITTPLTKEKVETLKAGDLVLLSGEIYTARDAAHKRLMAIAENGGDFPFDIKDSVIYYVGPTPEKEGQVIGSAGPTTSYRMDAYSPKLISLGHTGMIGKGRRGDEVVSAMKEFGAIYFGATGGAGALLGKCVTSCEIIAYEDLGAEAIRKLTVKDMPLTVVIDREGNNLYTLGREEYLKSVK